jgi:hypothetical protein
MNTHARKRGPTSGTAIEHEASLASMAVSQSSPARRRASEHTTQSPKLVLTWSSIERHRQASSWWL